MYGREELVDYGAEEHTVLKGYTLWSFSMAKDEIWHKSLFSLTRPADLARVINIFLFT